jgi:hypothetical protein
LATWAVTASSTTFFLPCLCKHHQQASTVLPSRPSLDVGKLFEPIQTTGYRAGRQHQQTRQLTGATMNGSPDRRIAVVGPAAELVVRSWAILITLICDESVRLDGRPGGRQYRSTAQPRAERLLHLARRCSTVGDCRLRQRRALQRFSWTPTRSGTGRNRATPGGATARAPWICV